jgi:hypothetical protein
MDTLARQNLDCAIFRALEIPQRGLDHLGTDARRITERDADANWACGFLEIHSQSFSKTRKHREARICFSSTRAPVDWRA